MECQELDFARKERGVMGFFYPSTAVTPTTAPADGAIAAAGKEPGTTCRTAPAPEPDTDADRDAHSSRAATNFVLSKGLPSTNRKPEALYLQHTMIESDTETTVATGYLTTEG